MTIEETILNTGLSITKEAIIQESILQGHYNTGAFAGSLKGVGEETSDGFALKLEGFHYGLTISQGVAPQNVPFARGSGAQSSQYIEGLTRYFMTKGLPAAEAKKAAFATAMHHIREGISTYASSAYSQTGKRQGFIPDGIAKAAPKANAAVTQAYNREIQKVFNKTKSRTI